MSMQRALALYAQVLGKKLGIKVVFQKVGTAATDGKTVYIDPVYNGIGTQAMAQTLFGLVAHEAMHLRLTDFAVGDAWRKVAAKQKANWSVIKHLQNVIEDVWGEREFCRFYPSVWKDICDSMVNMRKDGLYGPPDRSAGIGRPPSQETSASLFMNWWLAENLAVHYRQLDDFVRDAKMWRAKCEKTFGVTLVGKALQLVTAVNRVQSTNEAFELAMRVYDVIRDAAQQKPQKQQGSGGKPDGPPEEQKDGSGQAGQTNKPDQESGAGQAANESSQSSDVSGNGSSPEHDTSTDPTQQGQQTQYVHYAQSVLDCGEQDLENCKSDKGDAIQGQVKQQVQSGKATSLDVTANGVYKSTMVDRSEDFQKKFLEIRSHLSGRLERLLMANSEIDREFRRTGTRIAGSRLALIKTGVTDVFERSDMGQDLDTVVDIVVDASGSMRSIWTQTLAAAYAVADVLVTHQVPLGLVQFSGSTSRVHDFHKKWLRNNGQVPSMLGGGTDTSDALAYSASNLFSQGHARRIMLVITDGDPDNTESAVAIANEAKRAGIDIVHIFLGDTGYGYSNALLQGAIGTQARCLDSTDSLALAKAIESAIADSMAKHLLRAA